MGEEEFEEMLAGQKKRPAYADVLASTTYEEAIEVVKRIDPRSWVNNGDRIRENLRHSFIPKFPEYLFFELNT